MLSTHLAPRLRAGHWTVLDGSRANFLLLQPLFLYIPAKKNASPVREVTIAVFGRTFQLCTFRISSSSFGV